METNNLSKSENEEAVKTDEALVTQENLEAPVKNLAFYNRKLTPILPKEFFKPNPYRLLYALAYGAINLSIILAVLNFDLHWTIKVLAGLIIGQLNGGLAFVAHETLHGSVVKNKTLEDIIGFFTFAAFLMSPTYWRYWHNRLHHGHTQYILKDPDAFPTMHVYRQSKFMQRIFSWTPGSGTLRSYFYFTFWFSFQSFINQLYMRFGNKMWADMKHNRISIEFGLQILFMGSIIYAIGLENFPYLVLIPFMMQNYTIMSYISTNHNISPLTKTNDPLENSLTVTTNPITDFFHLNFGYHVEHHIFPKMSGAYTKKVHQELRNMFPDTYKFMKKSEALALLYSTPRIYKNHTTLIHPKTAKTYPTLPELPVPSQR